jgi:hypothetical protein
VGDGEGLGEEEVSDAAAADGEGDRVDETATAGLIVSFCLTSSVVAFVFDEDGGCGGLPTGEGERTGVGAAEEGLDDVDNGMVVFDFDLFTSNKGSKEQQNIRNHNKSETYQRRIRDVSETYQRRNKNNLHQSTLQY